MPIVHLRVRLHRPALDARLAAGESPSGDAAVALRAAQLVSSRTRQSVAHGLERALTEGGRRGFSAAAPVDPHAVNAARPYLAQLVEALRSSRPVTPSGMAQTLRLLTNVPSPLYAPAEPVELRFAAGQALRSLDPTAHQPHRTPSGVA
jgi:hypothetical protein